MSNVSFITQLKQLKTDLPGMTPTERVKHLWTYYKWLIPVLLAFILLLSVVLSSITTRSKTTIMGGVSVNVLVSEAGQKYLQEDYREYLGLTSSRQSVVFTETELYTSDKAPNFSDNYYALMTILSLCSTEQIDYLILDEEAISVLLVHQVFKDLREVYTQEELDAFGDRVIWCENSETGEAMPVVLEITQMPFIQDNTNVSGKVFFGYITNSPRMDAAKDLFGYLQAWKAEA